MKSCNDYSNDDEEQEKNSSNNRHDPNHLSRKRKSSDLSSDIEPGKTLNTTTTDNNSFEIKQMQIRNSKNRSHSFSTSRTQTLNDMSGAGSCGRHLIETLIKESKINSRIQDVGKGMHEENNNIEPFVNRTNTIAQYPDSLVTSCNDSHRITPSIPYQGIRLHSDEFLSSSTSYKVRGESLVNKTCDKDLQATRLQNSTIEDKIRGNGIFQHHINSLGVHHHTLPYLTIEVGERIPPMSASDMLSDTRRDCQSLTSALGHSALSSMIPFPFSFPPNPSALNYQLTRASDLLLSHLTLRNISRLTAANRLIASNPFAYHLTAQNAMHSPAKSPTSLPFGSPSRHIPPWSDTLSLLKSNEPSILQSWREELNTSNTLPITNSILAKEENQSYFIPNQVITVNECQDLIGSEPSTHRSLQRLLGTQSIEDGVPQCLPFVVALPEDTRKLSPVQVLLRQKIEFFSASEDDLFTHTRGRNKPITLKQVGIRCKHCSNLIPNPRKKGSIYFPFTLLGIYQAAQNMANTHFMQENCSENPSEMKLMILQHMGSKTTIGTGKEFWADAARYLGLLDTEYGIRFIRDLVTDSEKLHDEPIIR